MPWKTLNKRIQQLRNVAVLKVLFEMSRQHDNNPYKVKCPEQML